MPDQPTWQTHPCPSWCEREHEEGDREGDRDHQTDGIFVPIIRVIRHACARDHEHRQVLTDEVVVGAFQGQREHRPTVSIGLADDAQVCIELKDESAERLVDALRQLLDQLSK